LNLGLELILECDSIGGEFADTLTKLLNSHSVLVEVETEVSLVINVSLLLNIERVGGCGVQLFWDGFGRSLKLFKEVGLENAGLEI
jgi:hypothetical protein